MASRKILGRGVGIAIATAFLCGVAFGATLLEEIGVPRGLLVKFGALITIAGMSFGYAVSETIAGSGAKQLRENA